MKLLRLVEVEWVDSCRFGGWKDIEFYNKATQVSQCRSVGYLLEASRKQVKVVQSMNDQGDVTDSMSIPRSAVRKITILAPKKGGTT